MRIGREAPRFATVLAAALGIVVHACAHPTTPFPTTPPKIVFEQAGYDFGVAQQGTKLTHTFTFKNAGGLDLNIDDLRTSCGCTAAVSTHRRIAPGAAGAIDVAFDTASFFGPQDRTVTVYSNDPTQPVSTLTLHGRVSAEIAADPPQLYVGHVRRGQVLANEVRIVGDAVTQTGPVEDGKSVTATVSDNKLLHVAIRQDAPLGKFEDTLALHTRSPRHPLILVPVTGVVDGGVVVWPPQVNFGTTTPNAKASRVVGVQRRGTQAVHISAVHLTPDIGTAVATAVGEDYRVTVTLNAGLRPGKISGTLAIETDDAEQAHIEVPCVGRVAERS